MADNTDWYSGQTVFLTGGTGFLGACILYKLAVKLPTRMVFVLCRNSVQHAVTRLEQLMPEHIDEILDTRKVHFVVGNLDRPDWGMKQLDLQRLKDQVTVVFHAAAETSIITSLPKVVQSNCLSSLQLLDTLRSFRVLKTLLYVSSAFVNIFVHETLIKEELYSLHPDIDRKTDLNALISSIMESKTSPLSEKFPNPYIFSKYLAERAILNETDTLPYSVLVIRPSLISPAIQDPYPSYGVDNVTPLYSGLQMLVSSREYGLERLVRELPGDSYLDEIPVDLVANTCLAHVAMETVGIVHATGDLYARLTVHESAAFVRRHTPLELQDRIARQQQAGENSLVSFFFENFRLYCVRGNFDCSRSAGLKESKGKLGLWLEGHYPDEFARSRVQRMSRVLAQQLDGNSRSKSY